MDTNDNLYMDDEERAAYYQWADAQPPDDPEIEVVDGPMTLEDYRLRLQEWEQAGGRQED
jgi:hypothetical protein